MTLKSSRWVIATKIVHVIPLKTAQIFLARLYVVVLQQALRPNNIACLKCLVGEVHVRHVEEPLGDLFLSRHFPRRIGSVREDRFCKF